MLVPTRTHPRWDGLRSQGSLSPPIVLDHAEQSEIFGPDMFLPEQPGEPWKHSEFSPEKALMLAILEDAISCFQKYFRSTQAHPRRLAREAEHWIRRRDWNWPCSFDGVCDALGLDPERMRSALLRMKAEGLKAEQHLQPDPVPLRMVRLVRSSGRAKRQVSCTAR